MKLHKYCQVLNVKVQDEWKILSSPSPVPNPSPKSRSQIQVPNLSPKSKVQRKGPGTGADTLILQATTPPPITFLTGNVNLVMGKDLPWPSLTFHDLLCSYMTFYHLLRPLWPSMIKCLLLRPYLAGPLQINSQSIPRLDPWSLYLNANSRIHNVVFIRCFSE